jgi:hypothetical protein
MKVSSCFAGAACALVLGATTLIAQQKSPIGKGSWLVGGTAGLSHSDDGGGTTNVSLAPFGLYFFAPHLALGGTVNLAHSSSHTGIGDSHETFAGVEPTIRYFFGDLSGKLFPYLNASAGPSWEKFKLDAPSPAGGEQTTTGLALTASAGLMQMLATHVGLTGEVYYTHLHQSTDEGSSLPDLTHNRSEYGLRFGISAFVF